MTPVALVRPIPDRYADATVGIPDPHRDPIDVDRARQQHLAYVAALADLGFDPRFVPAAPDLPDSVFVEDTAVVVGRRAVILRSAHPGRQGEAAAVADSLCALDLDVVHLDAGTCDGGDVLVLSDRLVVGRSERTDDAGIAALARAVAPTGLAVVRVALPPSILHLECVCSRPAPGVVVVAEGSLDPTPFGDVRLVWVPREETYAANTVGHAGRVLVPAGFPRTADALHHAGLEPLPIEVGEIRKGDGSLTCLSLLVGAP